MFRGFMKREKFIFPSIRPLLPENFKLKCILCQKNHFKITFLASSSSSESITMTSLGCVGGFLIFGCARAWLSREPISGAHRSLSRAMRSSSALRARCVASSSSACSLILRILRRAFLSFLGRFFFAGPWEGSRKKTQSCILNTPDLPS